MLFLLFIRPSISSIGLLETKTKLFIIALDSVSKSKKSTKNLKKTKSHFLKRSFQVVSTLYSIYWFSLPKFKINGKI
ncbi:hypothetical protein BST83_16580 [Polaribacter filamentus]|uniref:Uncharacterized protein n=1 Tax=Polaribacter filamentus TaxID=53483 RepID=A0A2S7L0V6_9FLAO|nr:hypothetical protein BST83_16580 [Polaribacter filamentus]